MSTDTKPVSEEVTVKLIDTEATKLTELMDTVIKNSGAHLADICGKILDQIKPVDKQKDYSFTIVGLKEQSHLGLLVDVILRMKGIEDIALMNNIRSQVKTQIPDLLTSMEPPVVQPQNMNPEKPEIAKNRKK